MNKRWLQALGLVTVTGASALSGCSDDASNNLGSAGTSTAGTSNGVAGSSLGGSANGGTPAASAGSATAGSATAGNATAGSAGTGGSAGTTGSAGSGGTSDTGGGGAGGAAPVPTLVYDFETDAQGWKSDVDGVVVTTDGAQKVTGEKSLKVSVPTIAPEGNLTVFVPGTFWPGTVLTLHVYIPAGADGLWLQGFSQSDNWAKWDTAGNAAINLVRGGWTTITYTVPATFPGGLQVVGIQMGVAPDGVAFAGGDFYIDSVTALGGTESCAGTGAGSYDFEAADITAWSVDGDPAPADTALTASSDKANGGSGSLKVSLTALAGGTLVEPTARRIRVTKPVAYCTQQVTFNVWMPPGSEGITFQAFSQFNNYAGWNAMNPPAVVTRDGWTQQKYTLPAVGAGGLQVVGVQIMNTAETPFTGDVYIDDVSW